MRMTGNISRAVNTLLLATVWAAVGVVSLGSATCLAAGSERLGKELTPVGAEPEGTKDGAIPAWEGKIDQPTPGWSHGKVRGDFWKYKGEKALYTIDASNVDKYVDKLSPGHMELIKRIKGFHIDVYPSHRNCAFPEFFYENTKKNVGFAKIAANGYDIVDAYLPGVPFPEPQSGIEAMWNHKLRYQGLAWEIPSVWSLASPRKGATDWIFQDSYEISYFPFNADGTHKISELPTHDSLQFFKFRGPAAFAGQAGILTTLFNADAESYYYYPGQRRVRRLPSYAYDSPSIGWENEYPVDIISVYFGRLDRFNFKLVGKKELLIPYNTFEANDFTVSKDKGFHEDMPEMSHRRYELHRVWVVEATVKPDARHTSPKRTFYLDEDTWNILLANDYDAQGQMWRVRDANMQPYWDAHGACTFTGFINFNLITGRYITDNQVVGSGKDLRFYTQPENNPGIREDFYTPENMRAMMER